MRIALIWEFRRGRASSSTTTIFVECRSRQYKCESEICQVFFAGADKIILNCAGLFAPIIVAKRARVKLFLRQFAHKFFMGLV
jgi:hypothetical protein